MFFSQHAFCRPLASKQAVYSSVKMFSEGSTSSEEDTPFSRTPFNAIAAAAVAKRESSQKRPFPRVKAAAEDLEAFEYDELQQVADEERRAKPQPVRRERKSRYIGKLVAETERRNEELARVKERRLLREQEMEEAQYPGKEKFVTKGYRREIERREEEERKDREEMAKDRGNAREVVRRVFLRRGDSGNGEIYADSRVANVAGNESGEAVSRGRVADDEQLERNKKGQVPGEDGSNAAGHVGRKRRRSRFDVAATDQVEPVAAAQEHGQEVEGDGEKKMGTASPKKKRGLRRNDEKSISEYRKRYFDRMERRKREGDPLFCAG
eukprot:GFKZ01004285.1.p1 GENE.GFKZ01004285.1~~GFKZ01004285.1.p1  ORF type:complete len:324 (-),score=85.78 GFKZ01004285.1:1166-2137(-)